MKNKLHVVFWTDLVKVGRKPHERTLTTKRKTYVENEKIAIELTDYLKNQSLVVGVTYLDANKEIKTSDRSLVNFPNYSITGGYLEIL